MADIINNNIYGGAIIPSSFIFDFVHYGSYKTLTDNNDWKSMTIGRHCLIKYCNYAFTTEERTELESYKPDVEGNKTYPTDATQQQKDYIDAFVADGNRSYDGLIVQKTKDGPLMIGYTNHGINTDNLAANIESQVAAANAIATSANSLAGQAKTAAETAQFDADEAIKTLGYKLNENNGITVDQRIKNITTEIGEVEDVNTNEKTTIYGSINKINEEIDTTLTNRIKDFDIRTKWDADIAEGADNTSKVSLKLSTQSPNENTPDGTISIVNDNIYYGNTLLSRSTELKGNSFSLTGQMPSGETKLVWGQGTYDSSNPGNITFLMETLHGVLPVIQTIGTDGNYSSPSVPVKICIGSTAPTSTVDDITIWIKT